jgi:hypothetical protein
LILGANHSTVEIIRIAKGVIKMNVEVNYLAVLLAGVVAMGVGFLWYGPMLFAKPWMKLMGYTAESMKKDQAKLGKTYTISFVLALVTAYMLSHVMTFSESYMHYDSLTTGLTSALSMWVGFVAPVQATDALFGGKPWKLFWINTGYQLATLLAMGVVIGLM